MSEKTPFTEAEQTQIGIIFKEYYESDLPADEAGKAVREKLHPICVRVLPDMQQYSPEPLTPEKIVEIICGQFPRKRPKPPYRVFVKDGSGVNLIGEGTYVGDVEVYAVVDKAGHLLSNHNAEVPPETVPEGCTVHKIPKNPKIVMDSGDVVYGCQVWWGPVEKNLALQ